MDLGRCRLGLVREQRGLLARILDLAADLVEHDITIGDLHRDLVLEGNRQVLFVVRLAERDQAIDLADQLVGRHRALVDVLVGVNLEVAVLREALGGYRSGHQDDRDLR